MPGRKRPKGRKSGARTKARRKGPVFRKKFQRRKNASVAVIRQPTGIADRTFVKLNYSQTLTFTSTLGGLVANIFRGNGAFDPDASGVGGQPYFFDQWATFYDKYKVHGSRIKVEPVIPPAAAGSQAGNVTFALVPSNIATAFGPGAYELMREQPYSKFYNVSGEGSRVPLLKGYMKTVKIFGLPKRAVDYEVEYDADVGANPQIQWYWHVGMWTTDQATTSFLIPATITVTYYIEFFHRTREDVS